MPNPCGLGADSRRGGNAQQARNQSARGQFASQINGQRWRQAGGRYAPDWALGGSGGLTHRWDVFAKGKRCNTSQAEGEGVRRRNRPTGELMHANAIASNRLSGYNWCRFEATSAFNPTSHSDQDIHSGQLNANQRM